MTRDDIIRMAREVGFDADHLGVWMTDGDWTKELERFATIVAAAEREACAKAAEDMCEYGKPYSAAAAIRARGEKE